MSNSIFSSGQGMEAYLHLILSLFGFPLPPFPQLRDEEDDVSG